MIYSKCSQWYSVKVSKSREWQYGERFKVAVEGIESQMGRVVAESQVTTHEGSSQKRHGARALGLHT